MDPINVFRPVYRIDEIIDEIKICLVKGWTGLGFKTIEFEKAWCDYTGLAHSHFISSNTVGLHLALRVLREKFGWSDSDEIITTPLTFVSTNHAILYERFKPVFADVDEYLCLDPASVQKRINDRTRAVMFVGMGGNPGQLQEIKKICKSHNLKLILDAAHMAGTFVRSPLKEGFNVQHVGKEADVTVFSFQAVKNLPTADSGMICFKSKDCHEIVTKLSWLGIDKDTYARTDSEGIYKWKYNVPYIGYKYHGNSIMAAIGLVQLKYLDADNNIRNQFCSRYEELLNGTNQIKIIENSDYCEKSSRHLFQVRLLEPFKRDLAIAHLNENSIYPGVHYLDNTNYPMYKNQNGSCPKAHSFSEQLLSLPLHLELNDEDIKRVIHVLRETVEN